MEVHPHTHTERKKWYHYLWEFLMLFLAVFCGFLAENIRENLSNHSKEKEYMKSLVEDLESDTATLNRDAHYWQIFISNEDSLRKYLKPSSHKFETRQCYKYAASLYAFDEFNYSDRTIEELRNSGNFRIIRNTKIVDSLISYDNEIRNQLRNQEGFARNEFSTIISMESDLFDSYYIEKAQLESLDSTSDKNLLLQNNPALIFRFYNELYKYRWISWVTKYENIHLKKYADGLIALIKKEYHIE